MMENYSLNYDLFIRKLNVIKYLKKEGGLDFSDIAIIVKSEPVIIKTYCDRLLHLN